MLKYVRIIFHELPAVGIIRSKPRWNGAGKIIIIPGYVDAGGILREGIWKTFPAAPFGR